ncbi:MAG: efflux RND transporter periplasmic adaptor subunit, partial [Candidatus Eisenbacteria sp.]|nr:efflux RND transporter periplasmic adaptor subunit [Candidatus Eisenbacteria bacterium]
MRTDARTTWFAYLAVLLGALLVLAGCGRGGEEETAVAETFPVETVEVVYSAVSPVLTYTGTVLPVRKALLGAQIQGPIEKLHVDAGDEVREGDLLVELASEQLTTADAQYVAAEKDWSRMKSLLERGAVTQQAFDQADAAYQAVRATYEMVLESTRIRAPFDGLITGRYLDEGELFTLMSMATPSPAILELSNIDKVKVLVEVAAKERPLARVGLPAEVTVDAHPRHVFRGILKRIDPGLDRMSRTSTADIIIDNPNGELMPGMFADVELTLSQKEGLLVTRDAMIRQEGTGSFYAYVVESGTAHRRSL